MPSIRLQFRALVAMVFVAISFVLASGTAYAQANTAVFDIPEVTPANPSLPEDQIQSLTIYWNFTTKTDPASDAFKHLEAYLETGGNIKLTAGWPVSTEAGTASHADDPLSSVPYVIPAGAKITIDNDPAQVNEYRLKIPVTGSLKTRQTVSIIGQPTDWSLTNTTRRFSKGVDWQLPSFRGKILPGFGDSGNPQLTFSGDGVPFSKPNQDQFGRNGRLTNLSVSGTIPLNVPADVRHASGASTDASKQVNDAILVDLNSLGYSHGTGLNRIGLRARAGEDFTSKEAVVYGSPFLIQSDMYTAALEGEAGVRNGKGEWKDLTLHEPNTGDTVARVGMVVEFYPQILGVNKNVTKGLRFFIRGRGWADSFKNASGNNDVRWRAYGDSELFYDFSQQYRVFLRGEVGYLPPNLSERKTSIFTGVGAAF